MSGGRQAAETTHRAGFAALVGRTNVGKSTLLNTLVRQKIAIVSESPQTTRHRILGVRTMPGAQIAFLDTPGIHKPQHRMNRMMVSAALDSLRQVDLVLFLVDAAAGIGPGDRHMARILRSESGMPPVILVLNKVDLVRKPDLLPQIESASLSGAYAEIVPVSAREGDNCDRLLDVIVSCLPEGPPLYPPDTLTDQTERRLVGEIIREKILARTRQELPQETAVVIDRWIEREDGLIEIDAVIYCEKESQKPIIIGRGGSLLKRIGTEARQEIEALLSARVMLRPWVKVREGWREDVAILREMGIGGE